MGLWAVINATRRRLLYAYGLLIINLALRSAFTEPTALWGSLMDPRIRNKSRLDIVVLSNHYRQPAGVCIGSMAVL